MHSILRCLVMLMGCLFVLGCGPAAQPVWNKDSRSFFYTRADGAVCQFDLNKMAARTLLKSGEQLPRVVALSPDVNKLAFAQAALGERSCAVQVGVASVTGPDLSWSQLEIWGDPKTQRILCPTGCHWCPSGRRILVWYQQPGEVPTLVQSGNPFGRFALYDVASKKLTELTTATPAIILGQAINTSPICPDGSGYLAMKMPNKGLSFFFVTWDGWEYPLTMHNDVETILDSAMDLQAEDGEKNRYFFPLPQGHWSDQKLRSTTRRGTVVTDLKSKTITLEPLTADEKNKFDQIAASDAVDAPWMTLQVAHFQDDRFSLHCRMKTGTEMARVELFDSKENRRRLLIQGHVPENFVVHHLISSPDGKYILASLRDGESQAVTIHVVKPDGSIVTKIDTGLTDSGRGK